MADKVLDNNQVTIVGVVDSEFVYSHEVFGEGFYVVEVVVPYGKSDYLPCICWGRNARFAGKFEVGTHIHLWGRIQSRTYQKRIEGDQVERRTAYEISVSKIECIE